MNGIGMKTLQHVQKARTNDETVNRYIAQREEVKVVADMLPYRFSCTFVIACVLLHIVFHLPW